MPMELSQVSSEQLEMISLSPETEASREVCTTTTTIEAGAVPIVGGLTSSGVPIVSGIFLNRESRRTTTIITTTKTTYKILEDTSDDDLEFVQMPESTISTSTATTIKEKDDFLIINKTDSSITSTSEDDDNYDLKSSTSSLLLKQIPLKTKKEEDDEETVITTTNTTIDKLNENKEKEEEEIIVTSSNIVVIPSEIRSPPYSPHSFANTSTFSSPNSEGIMHTFDDEEFCAQLAKAAEASISPSFKTTTTKPVREISEEPLEHWVMLPDSQQQLKECSTQTTEEIEENHPSTSCWNEAKSVEIDNYVNVYSNGYYSKLVEDEEGILNGTKRDFSETNKSELETVPLEVERRHIGYYKNLAEEEKKPGAIEKLTQIFKESKKSEEYPVKSDPFTGQIASTSAMIEAKNEPIQSFVNIYSSGRSDEAPTTKTTELSLESPFTGNVSESNRRLELTPIPLEVEQQHAGYYDHLPSTSNEEVKKTGALEKLTHLFKRSKTDGDYPVDSEPYTGHLSSLNKISETREEPIHSMVSIYSSGRSDEEQTKKHSEFPINETPFVGYVPESRIVPELEGIPLEIEDKLVDLPGEISTKLTEYPNFEEIFIGHIHELQRNEVENVPLEVEKKYTGFYEGTPSTSSEEKKHGTLEKLTRIFKGSKKSEEFPVDSEPFAGIIATTSAIPEAQPEPIHSLVNVYSSGHSDEQPLTKPTEYPQIEEPFTGHITESIKEAELGVQPLELERLHTGFDQNLPTIHSEMEHMPIGFEKKHIGYYEQLPSTSTKTSEYPILEQPFTGHIHDLQQNEIESVPIEVENKHVGYYEHLPSSITSKEEKKPGTLEKLTSLFKGSKTEGDFLVDSEPYSGPITLSNTDTDLKTEPIHSMVSVYSSGRSDEVPTNKMSEFPINEAPFVDYVPESKLHSGMEHIPLDLEQKYIGYYEQLPSTSTKTSEYPEPEQPFIGHIHSLQRNEVEVMPLEVENNYIGFYDHLPSITLKEEKKPGTLEKLTKIFKGGKNHEDYLVDSEPYSGQIASTNTMPESIMEPLHSLVNVYSSGRSDEPPSTIKIPEYPKEQQYIGHVPDSSRQNELLPTPLEVERRYIGYYEHLPLHPKEESRHHGALESLTHFFKSETKHDVYPKDIAPFSGHLFETSRHLELTEAPIDNQVSVYSSGHYDEIPTKIIKISEFPINEDPFIGDIYEAKLEEIKEVHLEVERKNVGYYEHLPSTSTKTSEYPKIEQPFIGHIHSTRRNEVEDLSMNIENKHIGFYEHHPSKNQEEKKPGALEN
uniref:Uncharacterized protein n=1 Tax=Meloidogyne enterolobii TaxID=390850 RepID=A0A6V7WHU3_MELEN|nr:unnamed protein product [Meloidogyne enterolobii]